MKKNDITISSYNIFWKIMDNDNCPIDLKNKINIKLYKKNILLNIKNLYYYLNPDIYCFQEATDYNSILKIFDLKKYNFHINKSENEILLTIWNNILFKLIKSFDHQFEKGRPFTIFLFFYENTQKYILFINLHASHKSDTNKYIIKPIQEFINNNSILEKYKISRIIMSGDFNRDFNNENINNKYFLILNNKKYFFKNYINNNKTCCDINNLNYKFNPDQVIDTKTNNVITYTLNNEKWYNQKSSDHIMILSIIK